MKKIFYFCFSFMAFICSCSNDIDAPSHIPFKEVKSDNWGLVTLDGEIIVKDEFKEEPTPVVNDIFYVGSGDYYYMYDINNPTKSIGDKYADIAVFTGELAPSVKKDEWIKYINKKGETKIELAKNIKKAYSFFFGYSLIVNNEDLCGAINTEGKTIIPLKYQSIIPINENEVYATRDDKNYIYNIKEKKEKEVKGSLFYHNDYILFEEEGKQGIKNKNGNVIIRPKYSRLKFIDNNAKVLLAALNEDGWGIIDLDGNIIVKHKYAWIEDCQNDMFIALRDWDEGYGLLNMNEDRLIKYGYKEMSFLYGTDYLIAQKDNDHTSYILDVQGTIVNEYSELGAYTIEDCDQSVESDYFDMEGCADLLLFNKEHNINNLFSYAGKSANKCANLMGLSLNVDDITDNKWFPEKSYTNTYGEVYIKLGFNQVIESYYDGWEKKYSYYSGSSCDKVDIRFKPKKAINEKKFEETIVSLLKQKGFKEKEENFDTIYYNETINVRISTDRYSTIYIDVSLK